MKHSNISQITNVLKYIETLELKAAIQAHGGLYDWSKDENRPIIAINYDCTEPEPMDVCISKVYIEHDNVAFEGTDKQTGEPVSFELADIFAGQLTTIIENIPETQKVADVSRLHEFLEITVLQSTGI